MARPLTKSTGREEYGRSVERSPRQKGMAGAGLPVAYVAIEPPCFSNRSSAETFASNATSTT